MASDKVLPTTTEIYELLKRSSLPTVLVEGKDDIIFYRKIEEDLKEFGVDMLPAGNKGSVLELYRKLHEAPVDTTTVFVVDKDLWVHDHFENDDSYENLVTTKGYSIENDLYEDGDLESLLSMDELKQFNDELDKFTKWYALAVSRKLQGAASTFRTHPGKILDDENHIDLETTLLDGEEYPEQLMTAIRKNYKTIMRGKSLFALLLRELSSRHRQVKFSAKQLMEFGASRKGNNYQRLAKDIRALLERPLVKKKNIGHQV
jgi:hypothetical protein